MRELRGLTRLPEIARRIAAAKAKVESLSKESTCARLGTGLKIIFRGDLTASNTP